MMKAARDVSGSRDNSVLFALGELSRLEEARMQDEAAVVEAKRAQEAEARVAAAASEAAAIVRAEAEAKQAALVAEAEARLRVEAERNDSGRMASMRDEIARIREERELLHRTLAARSATPVDDGGVSSKRWALAFGTSSLVAASLAALLVFQARNAPTPMPAPVVAAAPIAITPIAPEPVVVAAPAPAVESATAEVQAPARRPRPTRTRPETRTEVAPTDELGFDLESNDVLEGIDEAHPPRRSTRRISREGNQ